MKQQSSTQDRVCEVLNPLIKVSLVGRILPESKVKSRGVTTPQKEGDTCLAVAQTSEN